MHNFTTQTVNAYYAILLITVAGGFATLLITHVADTGTFAGFNPVSDIAAGFE